MEKKVIDFIQDHQLIEKHKTILIGVSGGPDSMALLHLLHKMREQWNLNIYAVTVDHQLRAGDSEADVFYVKRICKKWDIPFMSSAVDVKAYKRKCKVSTQVAARKLRYKVFREKMNQIQADYLALGHHGDDQIETLIMSLARTTNLHSLTGIPVKRKFSTGMIIRPLLCVTKKEIENYCHKNDIRPRIDSTNQDPYYTRNDIRKSIVPKLKERNSNLHTTMQLLSESLQEDEHYLTSEAKKVVEKVITFDENGKKASLWISTFKSYPLPLQRRAFRLTLDYLYADKTPNQLTHMHESIFLSLINEEKNNMAVHFPKQLCIERSYDNLLFYFKEENSTSKEFDQEINEIPARISLPNGAILSITYVDKMVKNNLDTYTYVCLEDQLKFPIHIRTRRPGDRMRYKGLKGSKKIKDIFIDEKVPRSERDNIYVVADNADEIFWLIGMKKAILPEELHNGKYLLFEYIETNKDLHKEEENAKRH